MLSTILRALRRATAAAAAIAVAACAPTSPATTPTPASAAPLTHAIVPAPVSVELTTGQFFVVDTTVTVVVAAGAPAAADEVARQLADLLRPAARATRRLAAGEAAPARSILLTTDGGGAHGDEGYALTVAPDRVTIAAARAAGLFYGMQTLRQLLPTAVEHPAALGRSLRVPVGRVTDAPRYAWRGAMLDVSRHFLAVDDVKRYVDLMALYKLNRLHLHLADDQGWRIEIHSWPNLARHGGSTEVGGGAGGYYTQAEYADIVAHAATRHITVVPEIDMPGHTNAALASYPALNCDDVAPPLYTGTRVGFSALCVERDTVLRFVDDVVRELAALTPGPWIHLGGDEVEKLTDAQYRTFVKRVEGIVRAHGKRMIGWGEIVPAGLDPSTVVQHWKADSSAAHGARGGSVILSPARKVYLDMKYDSATVLGLRWAALLEVRDTYDWEPATYIDGLPERAILGVEAPLWSETLETLEDFEFLAFPRLLGVAELGWSQPAQRGWEGFRRRLAAHGPRLQALGVNFYRSPQIDW